MIDVYIPDPNRILKKIPIGDVQAWPARGDDTAVALSFFAHVENQPTKTAYTAQALYLSAADAREIARVLIEAADHADKVRLVSEQEAA